MTGPATPQAAWDAIATDFDSFTTPMSIALAEEALARVDVRPGTRFLDVGAGSGALSIPAAHAGAHVVATDLAPTMIERLRDRVRGEGLEHFEAHVMDVLALDLPEASFDVTGSQNGVTMLPDFSPGLAEMVRVTKPGGQVLVVAFGPLPQAEFITFFVGALQAAVPGFAGLPSDPPPPPFQVADPARFEAAMADAGLTDVRVEAVTWEMRLESAEHFWNVVTSSNPIGRMLVAPLDAEQRRAVHQVLDGMLRERSGGGPAAVLTTSVNIATGTK